MKKEIIICIYKITNLVNNKIYIGSTNNLTNRLRHHFNKCSKCTLMNRAIVKYGKENFSIQILKELKEPLPNNEIKNWLLKNEQYYLDNLLYAQEFIKKENTIFLQIGYNLQPIAGSSAFRKESNSDHKKTKIISYDRNGNFIKIHNSFQEASKEAGISTDVINRCCRTLGNISNKKRKLIYRYYTENFPKSIEIVNLTSLGRLKKNLIKNK